MPFSLSNLFHRLCCTSCTQTGLAGGYIVVGDLLCKANGHSVLVGICGGNDGMAIQVS